MENLTLSLSCCLCSWIHIKCIVLSISSFFIRSIILETAFWSILTIFGLINFFTSGVGSALKASHEFLLSTNGLVGSLNVVDLFVESSYKILSWLLTSNKSRSFFWISCTSLRSAFLPSDCLHLYCNYISIQRKSILFFVLAFGFQFFLNFQTFYLKLYFYNLFLAYSARFWGRFCIVYLVSFRKGICTIKSLLREEFILSLSTIERLLFYLWCFWNTMWSFIKLVCLGDKGRKLPELLGL